MTNHARRRASDKGLPFDEAAVRTLLGSAPLTCSVFARSLVVSNSGRGSHNDWSPTIDQVRPGEGYVFGNIQIISNRANRLKSNTTLEELRALVRYVETATAQ
jgi:hypothetical protein